MRNWRTTEGDFPVSKRIRDIAFTRLWSLVSGTRDTGVEIDTDLSDKVFGDVSKVAWLRNISMSEEILVRIFRIIAVAQEQLEKVE